MFQIGNILVFQAFSRVAGPLDLPVFLTFFHAFFKSIPWGGCPVSVHIRPIVLQGVLSDIICEVLL